MSKSLLVVAHPDDEILWFSSIIEKIDKIIIVFSGTEAKSVSDGRKIILNNNLLPYHKKVSFLEIDESGSFDKANWDFPTINKFGIKNKIPAYEENYYKIHNILKNELSSYDIIYTHNPCGEYGHEEHVQIFKVIIDNYNYEKQQIWVSGYFSDRSYKLMNFHQNYFSDHIISDQINLNLCNYVKKIYVDNKAWTWNDNYIWPKNDIFFKINKTKQLKIEKPKPLYTWPPMNFILIATVHSNLLIKIRSFLFRFVQKILSKKIINFLLKIKTK